MQLASAPRSERTGRSGGLPIVADRLMFVGPWRTVDRLMRSGDMAGRDEGRRSDFVIPEERSLFAGDEGRRSDFVIPEERSLFAGDEGRRSDFVIPEERSLFAGDEGRRSDFVIPEGQPSLPQGYVTECPLDSCELPRRLIAQGSKIPRGTFSTDGPTRLHLPPPLLSHDLHRAPVMSLSQIPVPLRDTRLFDAIQSGSAEWKHQLFQEYLGLVRGLLIKSMGPQAEVDDLVAEVFVGLFESAGNIRSAAGLRSYVVSVTMNTARREFRRRKRFNLFFLRDEGHEIAERTASVDDPKAKAALLQLHRILEGLDHEERLIFVLHVLEELPLQEAAASLSVSLSTAKRRLKRANERIRRRVAANPLLSEFVRERGAGVDAAGPHMEETRAVNEAPVDGSDGRPV